MNKKELIFISAPYGNAPDQKIRMTQISTYSANLMIEGKHIVCPMTLGIGLTKVATLPNDTNWWLNWTKNLLSRCDKMIVLCYENWQESKGVKEEIEFALNNEIEVEYEYFK